MRSKLYYGLAAVSVFLVMAAAGVLQYFRFKESTFRYGTRIFYYSNVLAMTSLIIILCLLVVSILTQKIQPKTCAAVSFGYSRGAVFWSKLITLSLGVVIMAAVILSATILSGNVIFDLVNNSTLSQFSIALINLLPIIASAFILAYVLGINGVPEMLNLLVLLFIYDILGSLIGRISTLKTISKWTPSSLLNNNLVHYMSGSAYFDVKCWMLGLMIIFVSLIIGLTIFKKKDLS
jgi:ABC-2 type transport system permease protein